ncbi:MAG: ribosome small subunit-dependent GTPase A [Ascidiaceihabitans sp.]|nr:ribosome small subunit-dependent GTPase A [Ascidiaceihabitans sp.]
MSRDYSQLFGDTPKAAPLSTLGALGWQTFFSAQTDMDEMAASPPVRVCEVHRNGAHVVGDGIDAMIPAGGHEATVGDWLLFNAEIPRESRLLERKSLIKRKAAGSDRQVQMIAANIDTAFVVTSCNQDFNIARLERFIALAFDAGVTPVVVLTKLDLCDDPADYIDQARSISELVDVVALDARGSEPREKLAPWCKPGQTVAFMGTSGVGKSTLTNALAGSDEIETAAIREIDARGRHTTTRRQLYFLPEGCVVMDTPGMRELQLADAAAGVGEVFEDIEELATNCKFNDCSHTVEPSCAIRAAVEAEQLDATRLARWQKLVTEDATNSANMAQRKVKDKVLGKTIKAIKKHNKK